MKNKFSKSLFLVLSTFGLLITSCSNSGKIIKPVEPETPGEMEDPESILDDFPYNPTNPINFDDKAYYYNDHINDVDPNFKLIVTINPELDNIAQVNALNYFNAHLNTSISITDRQGLEIDLATIQKEDTIELYPMNDIFVPGEVYIAKTNEKIEIDEHSAQFYLPRSSLLRAGISVPTALGDPGFNGHLSFLIINHSSVPFMLEKGVRFAQLVDFTCAGIKNKYDGDYNER